MRNLVPALLIILLACSVLAQEEAPGQEDAKKDKPAAKEQPAGPEKDSPAQEDKSGKQKKLTTEEIAAAIKALSSRFGEERKEARRKLISAGEQAVEPLLEELKSELAARRAAAADILGFIGSETAAEALLELARKDKDLSVREKARKAFARLGPAVDKYLVKALEEGSESDRKELEPIVRWRVTATIKNLVGPDDDYGDYPGQFDRLRKIGKYATPALLEIVKNSGTQSHRFLAITALGRLGDKSVVPELRKIYEKESKLSDREPSLRDEVVVSLAQLGDDSYVKKIIEHYQVESINKPENRFLYTVSLALFYHKLKKWKEAEAGYKHAIELNPENPNAYFNYACLLSVRNRTKEALAAFKTALEKGYRDAAWIMRDGEIENIRKLPEFKQLYDKHFGKEAGSE